MFTYFQPLEQFETVLLSGYSFLLFFPFSNFVLYSFFVLFLFSFLFVMSVMFDSKIIPKNWQLICEFLYNFVLELVRLQIGTKGQKYFPLIFVIFSFILISNLVGFNLYGFTITSHVSLTFGLSVSYFIFFVLVGIQIQKWGFLHTFVPPGAPAALLPALVVIEVISYVSRAFSLGIRLFANMLSGHTLLAIIANFAFYLTKEGIVYFVLAILPLFFIVVILFLELTISFLQAYVFAVLAALYLSDSLFGSH